MLARKKRQVIDELIAAARSLIGTPHARESAAFVTWRQDVLSFLRRFDGDRLKTFELNDFGGWASVANPLNWEVQEHLEQDVRDTIALLESARNDIDRYEDAPPPGTRRWSSDEVVGLCRRFPRAARQLQQRHASRPGIEQKDEYDVQDVLHAFLLLHFDDVRPEEWAPSYGGSSARVDFLLPDERIVIEVKRTRDKLGARDAKEQLAVDIDHYRVHPKCSTLVCFVYDPDHRITNAVGFEKDLEGQRTETLDVRVVVAPHG